VLCVCMHNVPLCMMLCGYV